MSHLRGSEVTTTSVPWHLIGLSSSGPPRRGRCLSEGTGDRSWKFHSIAQLTTWKSLIWGLDPFHWLRGFDGEIHPCQWLCAIFDVVSCCLLSLPGQSRTSSRCHRLYDLRVVQHPRLPQLLDLLKSWCMDIRVWVSKECVCWANEAGKQHVSLSRRFAQGDFLKNEAAGI